MPGQAPRFTELPSGPSPALCQFAVAFFTVFLIFWSALPVFFDPPPLPVHLRPLALAGQSCRDWAPIIRGKALLPEIVAEECQQLDPAKPDPIENPQLYLRPDDGMALLDPSRSQCGSNELRRGANRYLLILCSPAPETFNARSWMHEGYHLVLGHTALPPEAFPFPLKQAMNTLLETYVDLAMVLGKRGATWVPVFSLIAWLAVLFRRLHHW